jgi:Protein of unknown function (DUF1761)
MTFTGVNYWAILIAAVAGWLVGAGWYTALGKHWMAAHGFTADGMAAARQRPGAFLPFVYAFIANLVMAWTLAGIVGHVGPVTVKTAVISGALCWLGFVITTTVVNYSFAMKPARLIAIDGGHWLVVLIVIGAIIGAMGV